MLDLIKILYESEDVVAINKPPGLIVHPDGKKDEESVCDWVVKNYPESVNVGENIILSSGDVLKRPGIVHRIDSETSGVLLVAKTQKGFLSLKDQFKEREIKKTYRLFVEGTVREDQGVIDKPIGRSKSDFRKWNTGRGVRGEVREATTVFKVLFRNLNVSYIEAYPKTGRTHQIRVHFKSISKPVVCDSLYGKTANNLGFKRLALHAFSIEFKELDGKMIRVIASLPDDFNKAISLLGYRDIAK